MEEERYTVSQTEKLTGIRGHVLRYWEEELGLRIGRNAMGYRCYTRYDIQMFLSIKELKNRGLQLRAIRELIPKVCQYGPGAPAYKVKLLAAKDSDELPKKEEAAAALEESEEAYAHRMQKFQQILERLLNECLKKPTHEERRSCSLDEAIRIRQKHRREAAAAREKKGRKGLQLL